MVGNIARFVADWARCLIRINSGNAAIVKVSLVVLATGPALLTTDHITLAAGEKELVWHPEIGKVIWIPVLVIALAATFGITLVKFRRIRVGDEIDRIECTHYLSITN